MESEFPGFDFSDSLFSDSLNDEEPLPDASFVRRKLEKFELRHHGCLQESYQGQMEWWEAEVQAGHRCRKCWLMLPDKCYCKTLDQASEFLKPQLEVYSTQIQIITYYHYLEIGRSPNTAHLFDAICPLLSNPVIFGDSDKEIQLFDEMKSEFIENKPSTCVLYPTSGAISLSEWMAKRALTEPVKPMRFIILDGTYAHASRQFKHLKKVATLYEMPLPVVKLDLGEHGCKSAIVGIMKQPEKDKICSFQAIVLALKQAGMDESLCSQLRGELDRWLQYMLKSKIKIPKSVLKFPPGLKDTEAIDYLNQDIPELG